MSNYPKPTSVRLEQKEDGLLSSLVERRGVSKADWIRKAVCDGLDAEMSAGTDHRSIREAIRDLQRNVDQILQSTKAISEHVNELAQTAAMERAADRVMQQQSLRMIVRSLWILMGLAKVDTEDEDQDGFTSRLEADADRQYEKGLRRIEGWMREAREDCRATLTKGMPS